ncbi:hypothetical protein BDV97DRAFT_400348 [Delphinella strobiligena]|nr:hypothetical protein BDV97DRAFT_400348 [Delphinella strobiligena]
MLRSFASRDRAGKLKKPSKRSFRDDAKLKLIEQLNTPLSPPNAEASPRLHSAIVTIVVGKDERLFAAHEDVLRHSPFFVKACKEVYFTQSGRRIFLPDEEPEIFSAILEYLYKGDYYPRLLHDKRRNTWVLEDAQEASLSPKSPSNHAGRGTAESVTMHHRVVGGLILRDTAVYCTAERFGLEELKRLALRKQGLQSGIEVGTILRSARFAYDNTPETDSRLRAHYLALIIRSRGTFKRSGTMQMEMESGSRMFFDLFVAMCNHIDDIVEMNNGQV